MEKANPGTAAYLPMLQRLGNSDHLAPFLLSFYAMLDLWTTPSAAEVSDARTQLPFLLWSQSILQLSLQASTNILSFVGSGSSL